MRELEGSRELGGRGSLGIMRGKTHDRRVKRCQSVEFLLAVAYWCNSIVDLVAILYVQSIYIGRDALKKVEVEKV